MELYKVVSLYHQTLTNSQQNYFQQHQKKIIQAPISSDLLKNTKCTFKKVIIRTHDFQWLAKKNICTRFSELNPSMLKKVAILKLYIRTYMYKVFANCIPKRSNCCGLILCLTFTQRKSINQVISSGLFTKLGCSIKQQLLTCHLQQKAIFFSALLFSYRKKQMAYYTVFEHEVGYICSVYKATRKIIQTSFLSIFLQTQTFVQFNALYFKFPITNKICNFVSAGTTFFKILNRVSF